MSKSGKASKLEDELKRLVHEVRWVTLNIDKTPMMLDSACEQLLTEANFIGTLKARNIQSTEPVRYCAYDWLQQPICGYFDRKNSFRILAGLFAYQQAIAHNLSEIPAFVYDKPPIPKVRRSLIIAELTRILLDQQPKDGVEQLRDVLCAVFQKEGIKANKSKKVAVNPTFNSESGSDQTSHDTVATSQADLQRHPFGTTDIFNSEEWQSLYPGIKNKNQFCKWQGISSKTFRDNHNE